MLTGLRDQRIGSNATELALHLAQNPFLRGSSFEVQCDKEVLLDAGHLQIESNLASSMSKVSLSVPCDHVFHS